MRRPSARILLGTVVGTLALGSVAARGDDWPQFRRDAGRTGASQDKTRFPVTDVWTWSTRGVSGDTPTYDAAVVRGRIFFTALENKTRYLICADAKTGTPIWRQPLAAPILPVRGVPVVSSDGKVYVYDHMPGKLPPTPTNRERFAARREFLATIPEEIGGLTIRAFHVGTGYPLASLPISLLEMEDDLPEVTLFPDRMRRPVEETVRPSGRPVLPHDLVALGTPLLIGSEFQAFTNLDIYLRWAPNTLLEGIRIRAAGQIAPAEFWGFPPVSAGGGILVANDQADNRFFTLLGGDTFNLWHHPLPHTFGIPAAADNEIFVGLGKLGATKGLACLESSTGLPRWMYAPTGLSTPATRPGQQKLGIYASEAIPLPRGRNGGRPSSPRSPRGGASGDLRARMEDLVRTGFRIITRPTVTMVRRGETNSPPGHESSGGVVVTEKQVFAEVDGAIVGLERGTGRPIWRQPIPGQAYVQSLVGSPKHVIASYTLPASLRARTATPGVPERREGRQRTVEQIPYWDRGSRKSGSRHFVVAYQAEDGKKVWEQELLQPGSFALSEGLIYFANGDLTAYGPAERVYLVAEDSDEPKEYVTPAETEKEPEPDTEPAAISPAEAERLDPQPAEPKEPEPLDPEARADVSIVRLTYDTPFEQQLEKVRDRRKLLEARRVPLILQLDWLDPQRSAVRGARPDVPTPSPEVFAGRCALLAKTGEPYYFDLAPEVNIYLRRYPERSAAVLELLAGAALAVKQASPGCQVVFTLNTEVLLESYGKGMVYPYGKLPKGDLKVEPALLAQLVGLADAVGLSTRPYAGFRNAGVLPPDYLLRARKLFDPKPILVTQIVIDGDVRGAVVRGERAAYAHRILQACYWLNARVVAQADILGHPEMTRGEDGGTKDPIRLVAEKWQRVITWPRVSKLTAMPPTHLPEALDPEGPRETGD